MGFLSRINLYLFFFILLSFSAYAQTTDNSSPTTNTDLNNPSDGVSSNSISDPNIALDPSNNTPDESNLPSDNVSNDPNNAFDTSLATGPTNTLSTDPSNTVTNNDDNSALNTSDSNTLNSNDNNGNATNSNDVIFNNLDSTPSPISDNQPQKRDYDPESYSTFDKRGLYAPNQPVYGYQQDDEDCEDEVLDDEDCEEEFENEDDCEDEPIITPLTPNLIPPSPLKLAPVVPKGQSLKANSFDSAITYKSNLSNSSMRIASSASISISLIVIFLMWI